MEINSKRFNSSDKEYRKEQLLKMIEEKETQLNNCKHEGVKKEITRGLNLYKTMYQEEFGKDNLKRLTKIEKGLKIKIGRLLKFNNIPKYDNKIGSRGYTFETDYINNIEWLTVIEHHTSLAKKMFPEVIKILKNHGYNIEVNQDQKRIYFLE